MNCYQKYLLVFASAAVAATPAAAQTTSSTATAAKAAVTSSTDPLRPLNPIRLSDTPDPGVVRANGKWYVYHTSSGRRGWPGRYPIVESANLTDWKQVGYIFLEDQLPPWCNESISWWAPEVHKVGNKYIAYYTARQNGSNRFAIGAAIADHPAGPFKDVGAPIVHTEGVGLIDVTWFKDPTNGKQYLIWKEDRNDFNPPEPTPIIMQEMAEDGLKVVGQPKEILRNDLTWEGVLVEAPTLIHHGGWYYLFYSANAFSDDAYAVGVSRSRDIWGPYTKNPERIIRHNEDFSGPGHQFIIQDEKGVWHMFYHARLKKLERSYRYLMHDIMTFGEDGWPKVNDGFPGPVRPDALERIAELRREAAQRRSQIGELN
jgi:arabinan endo-1,5-alpha-L-arabinosidase